MTPKTTPSGSVAVCPGSIYTYNSGSTTLFRQCLPVLGTHTYTITVKNGAGQVVATKVATLVVTQAPVVP